MKREKTMEHLSDAELDIMRVLWASDKPLRAGEIVKLLAETRSWKTQTAHVLLNRLCEKGFVTVDKSAYFHHFAPIVTETDYVTAESRAMIRRNRGAVRTLVASLIDTEDVTAEDLDAIAAILAEKQAEIRARGTT